MTVQERRAVQSHVILAPEEHSLCSKVHPCFLSASVLNRRNRPQKKEKKKSFILAFYGQNSWPILRKILAEQYLEKFAHLRSKGTGNFAIYCAR